MSTDPKLPVVPRAPNGHFAPGQPRKRPPSHRGKGVRNKLPISVREAILEAADAIGSNGVGQDGLRGFLEAVGRSEPHVLAMGVYRLLPTPKPEDEASSGSATVTVNIVPVPSGMFLSQADAEREWRQRNGHGPDEPIIVVDNDRPGRD